MDTHKVSYSGTSSKSDCPDALSWPSPIEHGQKVIWTPVMHPNGIMSRYLSEFEEIEKLGTRGSGTVVKCRSKIDGLYYAVKQIPMVLSSSVEREAVALSRLNHPNIVRYYTSWYEASVAGKFVESTQSVPCFFIQLEFCKRTLRELGSKRNAWGNDPNLKWRIFHGILLGVSHIHEKNFIHMDLCPENIFLDENDNPKIGDFGLVEILEDKGTGKSASIMDGNKLFQAPECNPTYLEGSSSKITKKSDIYSVGLILADLSNPGATDVRYSVLKKTRNGEFHPNFTGRVADIVKQIVINEPEKRPEIRQIINLLPHFSTTMEPKLPHLPGLPVDLRGKRAFVTHIVDDKGFAWAIAKSLAAAGAEILVGVPIDALDVFNNNLIGKKFDTSRKFPDGTFLEFKKVYGLNASYGAPEDVVPDELYGENSKFSVEEVFKSLELEFSRIDILVHSAFEFPEVIKSLEEISKSSYIDAICKTSYPLVALAKYAVPIMNPGGSIISLTYNGSQEIIPACGLGMSSSLAASENVIRMLAYEVGQKQNIRVNAVSVGLVKQPQSKRRKVDSMIKYSLYNAPLKKELISEEVGNATAFLASPLASAITGSVIYVDNGLHSMGMAIESS